MYISIIRPAHGSGIRPRHLPERLSAALERAQRAGALTGIDLGALTPDEARELLGDTVGLANVTVLYEESGGNPFYLEQLARALERSGGVVSDVAAPPGTPRLKPESIALLTALLAGDWVIADASDPTARREARGIVAAYLQFHLERSIKSLSHIDSRTT